MQTLHDEAWELRKCELRILGRTAATPEELRDVTSKCVTPVPGISKQYVYRSLYASHISHCLEAGLPRDQLLVVDAAALRDAPGPVLDAVYAFIGVDPAAAPPPGSAEELARVFDESYPSFGEKTGWGHAEEYAAMPDEMRAFLSGFFKPYNDILCGMGFGGPTGSEGGGDVGCGWPQGGNETVRRRNSAHRHRDSGVPRFN